MKIQKIQKNQKNIKGLSENSKTQSSLPAKKLALDQTEYLHPEAITVSGNKLFRLWGSYFTSANLRMMKLDETAKFSVTDARTADRITKLALDLPGMTAESRFVDGCACVGGNLISFARVVRNVSGFELDASRYSMLVNNIAVAGVRASAYNVDLTRLIMCDRGGDALATNIEITARFALCASDLLFMDPPWGGPEVWEAPMNSVELQMSRVDIADLCRRVAGPGFRTRYILLKLPPNYKLDELKAKLADLAVTITFDHALRKIVLAIITLNDRKSL
jgi:16S rRNA G966 N2-methylase RsmD